MGSFPYVQFPRSRFVFPSSFTLAEVFRLEPKVVFLSHDCYVSRLCLR